MYLQFDKSRLHLQVLVGILEKYEPTEKHESLQAKLVELKAKVEKFQNEVVFPAIAEIDKEITEENEKFTKAKEPPQ